MKKNMYRALAIFCLLLAVFSGYKIYAVFSEYRRGEQEYKSLQRFVKRGSGKEGESAAPHSEKDGRGMRQEAKEKGGGKESKEAGFEIDFASLREINEDVVGWILMEDSVLNYPVVQAEDNSYYLHRLFDKTGNACGSIFLDGNNAGDFSDGHSIIYGHHMKDGSMFACLSNFKDEEYYKAHKSAYLLTEKKKYKIEFFAGYVSDIHTDAWRIDFASDEERLEWARGLVGKSDFESDVALQLGDRIITLSTCSYEFADARYVVSGILREMK